MSSISGNTPSVTTPTTNDTSTVLTPQGTITTVDTIDSVDGSVSTVSTTPNEVSIEDYVQSQGNLTTYFDQLLKNKSSDTFLKAIEGEAGILNSIPSAAEIQSTYNTDVGLLNTANDAVTSLNNYNTNLNTYGKDIQTAGTAVQADSTSLQNADYSSTYSTQESDILNLISSFETGYPSGMSESSFTSLLQGYLTNSQTSYNDETAAYNSAAGDVSTYNTAISNYQSTVDNAPSQTDWDNAQSAINSANSANTGSGGFYPTLPTLPDVTIATPSVSSTQTSITSGTYDSKVSWPDPSSYTFVTKDSSGNSVVDTAQLTQLTTAVADAYVDAKSYDLDMQNDLSTFVTTDYTTQLAQLAPTQTQQLPLTVPTLVDFQNSVLQNFLGSKVQELGGAVSDFTNEDSETNPTVDSSAQQDQIKFNQLKQQMASEVASIGLTAVGGDAIVGIGGLGSFSAITTSLNQQANNINKETLTQPTFSTDQLAFLNTNDNYQQTVVGAASILGTIHAYKDATNLLNTSPQINSSLLSLNTLESYNSLIGSSSQSNTLTTLAQQSVNSSPLSTANLVQEPINPSTQSAPTNTAPLSTNNLVQEPINPSTQPAPTTPASLSTTNLVQEPITPSTQSAPTGTTNAKTLADQGTIPFSLTTTGQRAVLVAQDVGGDKGAFTAAYLAGFTQSALDAYLAKGPLNTDQQQSVESAQKSLVGLLSNNNVDFSFLKSSDSQEQVANAFQTTAQQLSALGYNISPTQLSDAQAAFFSSLSSASTGSGTSTSPSTSSVTSVSSVSQLLVGAIAANVTGNVNPDVVANSIILHFDQNEASYRIQVKNEFQQTQTLNTTQAAHFSKRLKEAALGTAQQDTVDALTQSTKVNDNNFAEQLANATSIEQEVILGSQVLEGAPDEIPGTDILNNSLVAKNDLTPVPTQKRTTFIPV